MSILTKILRPDVRKLGAKKNIKGLTKALSHKDTRIQQEALAILSEIGDPTFIEPFVTILQNLEKNYRSEKQQLAKESNNIDFLIHRAKELREKYKKERAKSLWALKIIGDSNSIEPLVKELKKVIKQREREGANLKITREEWHRIQEIRNRPIWALRNIGKSAVSQIIETGKSKEEKNQVRTWMILILALREDATAVEPIIQIALDEREEPTVREEAINSLKWFVKDPRIVEPLRRLTKVENNSLRKKAEQVLESIRRLQL